MKNVILVGAGEMATAYASVLQARGIVPVVLGRGEDSARQFEASTGLQVVRGGLDGWLPAHPASSGDHVIVAVGVEALYETTSRLLAAGYRNLLIEKPGALNQREMDELAAASAKRSARVFIGYNRRFMASTLMARQIIEHDGGVVSFQFEFTEWSHVIGPLVKAPGVKERWFLANSTHVADLAFFLGGHPSALHAVVAGGCGWHPSGTVFAGSGITAAGLPFSYSANWEAPGRWGVEVLTRQNRLIFRPLETLQMTKRGSVAVEPVALDDSEDKRFKPGVYQQVSRFLEGRDEGLCSIAEQAAATRWYEKIAGYDKE